MNLIYHSFLCILLCSSVFSNLLKAQGLQTSGTESSYRYRGQQIQLEGVNLWYIDTQTKENQEVLVLLHPNSGNSDLWAPQIEAFSKAGFRVIAFDRRGWGKSVPLTTNDNGALSISEDLDHLMTKLNIHEFNLLGIAGGGFAALDYAADHMNHLKRLIIGGSTAQLSDKSMLEIVERIEIPGIRKTPTYFREVGPSYRAANVQGTLRWIEIEEHSMQNGVISQKLHTPNTLTKIATIQTPTLVIAADADLLAPPPLMKIWADKLPHHEWASMPGIGHAISWEAPEMFNRLVLDFLNSKH
jgi:pimeloyl-ACP methyl ester carboxylesterase